jgi:hypothetical protein
VHAGTKQLTKRLKRGLALTLHRPTGGGALTAEVAQVLVPQWEAMGSLWESVMTGAFLQLESQFKTVPPVGPGALLRDCVKASLRFYQASLAYFCRPCVATFALSS